MRWSRIKRLLGSFWVICFLAAAAPPEDVGKADLPGGRDWKFDVLLLKNGKSFQGLLVEERPEKIRFQCVMRRPGERTVVFATTFAPQEVARLTRLDPAERARLQKRLQALDPSGQGEQAWMETLRLRRAPWGSAGRPGWSYRSEYFILHSDAEEGQVRRAAAHLEQIYAAYTRFLPATRTASAPTTILLAHSPAEYRRLLKEQKRSAFRNPAFYDPSENQIVCASDLQQRQEDLRAVREQHDRYLRELDQREADLGLLPKGDVQDRLRRELQIARRKIEQANQKNQDRFAAATRRFYQTLYHEAFHAYLGNFAIPPGQGEVPRWLNEGLAQIFETAVVEAGELRIGHADKNRLGLVQEAVRRGGLVAVADLLKAGSREFVVAHASDQQLSDRYYLASWALAFYLTFERRKLGTPELAAYVSALKDGRGPVEAFQEFVGQPLPPFEQAFHRYLLALRRDGTTAHPVLEKQPDRK
jgi:hypothetical protein